MKHIWIVLLILMPILAEAETVEINGLYYNLIEKGHAAEIVRPTEGIVGEISIPANITYENKVYNVTAIGDNAFEQSKELLAVHIPESIKKIGSNAFASCEHLNKVFITNLTSWCGITFGDLPFYYPHELVLNGSVITQLDIPEGVTFVSDNSFCYLSSIETVRVPSSVLSIGANAFTGCESLNTVVLTEGLTNIGERAFQNCTVLNSIDLPNSISQIDDYAFAGSGLTTIDLPNNITILGNGVFSICSKLESVTLPNSLTMIREGLFLACSSLKSVEIPNTVTTIMRDGFRDCSGLTSVTLSNNLSTIEKYAFYGCRKLGSISIPEKVLGINDFAFGYCKSLKEITLGGKLNWIGEESFGYCESIENVYCYAEEPPKTGNNAFIGSYTEYAKLYVPDAVVNTYRSTSPWSGFEEIKPLSESNGISYIIENSIKCQGINGRIIVEGVKGGSKVYVFSISGLLIGKLTAVGNEATIETGFRKGNIAIVKIEETCFKIIMH